MHCTLCGHNWCWSCGFSSKNYIMHDLIGDVFCDTWNKLFSQLEINVILKLLITVVIIVLAPVGLFLLMVFGAIVNMFNIFDR